MNDPILELKELRSLPIFEKKEILDSLDNKFLEYIIENPGHSAYDFWTKTRKGTEETAYYKTIRRHVEKLRRNSLIKVSSLNKLAEHRKRSCRLNAGGIFCFILKERILTDNIIKAMLRNYGDNILFRFFLYPYIDNKTILEMTNVVQISLFFYDCCKAIEDALLLLKNTKRRHTVKQIFIWQDIPANEYETNRLREFLRLTFNLDWIQGAQFHKVQNEHSKTETLIASAGLNVLSFTLNDKQTNITLKIQGIKRDGFIVKKHHPKWYSIETPVRTIEEYAAFSLLIDIQQQVPAFIFNLTSRTVPGLPGFKALLRDESFMRSLKKIKRKFDYQYKILLHKSDYN